MCKFPCNARGFPKCEWVDGQLRMASTPESERAKQFLKDKYDLQGTIIRIFDKFRITDPHLICAWIQADASPFRAL
jgi:hypothetical protein